MKKEYLSIEDVSRAFEMSQVWLHQLRIAGEVRARVVCNINHEPSIQYNIADVEMWVNAHNSAYMARVKLGYFDRVSVSLVLD